jgi:hypothetical protein
MSTSLVSYESLLCNSLLSTVSLSYSPLSLWMLSVCSLCVRSKLLPMSVTLPCRNRFLAPVSLILSCNSFNSWCSALILLFLSSLSSDYLFKASSRSWWVCSSLASVLFLVIAESSTTFSVSINLMLSYSFSFSLVRRLVDSLTAS